MMDRRFFIAGGMALVAMPRVAAAQAGWMRLGSRLVNWSAGRDSIIVTRRAPLRSLSFIPRSGEIFITDVEVTFARGGSQRLPMNARLRPNLRSPTLRLRQSSDIRRIDFSYRRPPPGRRPRTMLDAFGRR